MEPTRTLLNVVFNHVLAMGWVERYDLVGAHGWRHTGTGSLLVSPYDGRIYPAIDAAYQDILEDVLHPDLIAVRVATEDALQPK